MAFGVIGMFELLKEIRKPKIGKGTLNDLAVSCGVLALGITLGIFAKWLDALAIDDTIWWQNLIGRFNLGIIFSEFGVWMMLAVVISVKSRSPLWAALRVLLFFAGMTVSYHWYSVHVCGFDPLEYMKIWYSIAAISPGFAMAGPEVTFRLTPISLAMMPANVVFPSPGGPYSKT